MRKNLDLTHVWFVKGRDGNYSELHLLKELLLELCKCSQQTSDPLQISLCYNVFVNLNRSLQTWALVIQVDIKCMILPSPNQLLLLSSSISPPASSLFTRGCGLYVIASHHTNYYETVLFFGCLREWKWFSFCHFGIGVTSFLTKEDPLWIINLIPALWCRHIDPIGLDEPIWQNLTLQFFGSFRYWSYLWSSQLIIGAFSKNLGSVASWIKY